MRILSISGQNIASLGPTFSLDFTAEPLASAGLFAITGETGAGKSSILDAMCLALYGEAPRLAGGNASDEVPDMAGEMLRAKDPRAILRRGAAQGWAEVRFAALDGQIYRAHWQARRARERAEGKLQAVSRSLARDDGQILAQQTTLVSQKVQELSGLSYDEFRRTVLLAQGDFDAFLRADTNDRAALLEKVTGTRLYRAVSARVYERSESARQAYDTLLRRQEGYVPLSDEALVELGSEREKLGALAQGYQDQQALVRADLNRHARHQQALEQLAHSLRAREQAEAALNAAGDLQAQLALLQRAEPLRPLWQAVGKAESLHTKTAQEVQRSAEARSSAEAVVVKAGDHQRASEAVHTQIEEGFKALGPQWDQASALDAHLTSSQAEVTRATEVLAQVQRAEAEVVALQAAQIERLGLAEREQTKAADKMAGVQALAPLVPLWPQIAADLAARQESLAQEAAAMAEIDQARQSGRQAQAAAKALTEELAEIEAAERGQQAALDLTLRAMTALEDRPDSALQLAQLSTHLTTLRTALQQIARADEALSLGTDLAAKASEAIARHSADVTRAAADAQHLDIQIATLRAPLQQADLAASEVARRLRTALQAGCPCPVCGATEHPHPAEAGLLALADQLRAQVATLNGDLSRAHADQARAHKSLAEAEAAQTQALRQQNEARDLRQSAESQAQSAQQAAIALGSDLREMSEAALTDQLRQLQARQAAEVEAQDQLRALRRRRQDQEAARDDSRRRLREAQSQREALSTQIAEARHLWALGEQALSAAAARKADIEQRLLPQIALCGLSPDSPDLAQAIQTRLQGFEEAQRQLSQAQSAVAEIETSLHQLQQSCQQQQQLHQNAAQDLASRQAQHQALAARRAQLLGGQETSAHRSAYNLRRRAALQAWQEANTSYTQALAQASAADAKHEALTADHHAACAAHAAQVQELDEKRHAAGLTALELTEALAVPLSEAESLARQLQALHQARDQAHLNHQTRAQDLADLIAQGLPEAAADLLQAQLDQIDDSLNQTRQRIGAIDNDLTRDAQTRATLAGFASQMQAAQAEANVWAAVNDAIGSRNGDRFARIAQSITLDLLVDHANRHLADLNPRYALKRGRDLALQVLDLDMGGEERATRSLSGGERFLVSLALALALSRMGGPGGLAATLFIDEGFGALDAQSLDLAMDALERLQSQGRQVGVISHVEAMKDRIPTRIAVVKEGGGRSKVVLENDAAR